MNSAPHLSHREITEQLDKLYKKERKRHLVAFYGTGTEEVVRTIHAGEFRVIPVRSELDLRDQLPALEDAEARIAFLVPWSTELPADLAGRFALQGRIMRIGRDARLGRLFGATEIDEDARRSALAEHLLLKPPARPLPVSVGRLTLAAMWATWLATEWGVEVQGGIALDTLLGWAAFDERGARFVDAMNATDARGVRDKLLAHLEMQLGPAGPAVWRAWEAGRGRVALEHALVFETLVASEHAGVRMWVKLAAKRALGFTDETAARAAAVALGQAAGAALRYVERRAGEAVARGLVKAADGYADDSDVREALVESPRLPSSWRQRLNELGTRLEAVAQAPDAKAVARADQARRYLEGHAFFKDEDQTRTVKRAEMAVRLLAWLAVRPDRMLEGGKAPYSDAEMLARWYAEEGGFVDLARRWARGSAEDAFGRGVQAVVDAADVARAELDRRFARSLRSWVDSGKPATCVLPIEQAVRRIAVRFLEEEPSRRLLVLLLDGMGWAQAVDLLQSLSHRTAPWGPLAWHASAKGRIGEGAYPAVLASLPTITEVSRAAFFAGKAQPTGMSGNTAKDVERWRSNPEVGKLLPAAEAPRLLLRAEGHTREGSASPEALSLVGDVTKRIVAIVINAIDASLKGDPQQRHEWTVEHVWSLPELLDKAREAGRAVLLASDHGHVPADRLASIGAAPDKGGARWRPWWTANDPLREDEVGFAGSSIWAPKGAHGAVLLADDGSRYGGSAHAGEHGGASLAEVVAPCLLIGCEDVAAEAAGTDRGITVRRAYVPPWWHFDVRETPREQVPVAVAETPRPKKVDERQLSLTLPEPEREFPKRTHARPDPGAESTFARSDILAARAPAAALRRQTVQAVEFLLERRGVASDAAFATAMNEIPWRVGGLVSRLQEVLNVEGYQVLRYDAAARQVYLDRDKLAQQFEVVL